VLYRGLVSKGRTRYRAPRGVPLSAVTVGRRRGRFRGRARLVLAIVFVLAVVGLVAVAMHAFGKSGSGASAPPPATVPPPADPTAVTSQRAPRTRHSAKRPHARSANTRAINRVLAYTPFIAGGTEHRKAIALTFDDGPSPYTPEIVQELVRLHVPATFFVVGQQLTYFAAGVHDELSHGFVVGDHTQNHAWLIRLSAAGQYEQVQTDATELERLGAPRPRLFRPPYGAYDADTLHLLHQLGMLMVMWSIDPSDWRRPGTQAIVSNVLENARPGAIVILHDGGGDRSQTVAALPAIVRGLRRRGYRLVTVPQLLMVDPPPRHQQLPHLSGV
jgi:peptidoglycan-N-acetylglucosamine deacetylase